MRGFTLVEAVIAVAMLGLATGGLTRLVAAVGAAEAAAQARLGARLAALAALEAGPDWQPEPPWRVVQGTSRGLREAEARGPGAVCRLRARVRP